MLNNLLSQSSENILLKKVSWALFSWATSLTASVIVSIGVTPKKYLLALPRGDFDDFAVIPRA